MCGIAGILSTQIEEPSMISALKEMQRALNHRGPDGNGRFHSPSKHAALTHTRLAIIDLSEKAAQPMTIDGGRYTVSFNGEIYNYQSLRDELINEGVEFTSRSDTEVLVRLYAQYGSACVTRLRGMFAFVIWDELEQSAFAARDPFGIKPLYYWQDSRSLVFASEVRSVIASGFSDRKPCPNGLVSYFKTGTVAEPDTIINDIKMLPAGHTLAWQAGKTTIQSFWQPQFINQEMTREQALTITREALKDSVRAHLVSDVPVGIFLSGGIDSTVLVALATQISQKPVNTYSIAFIDAQWNEGNIAKQLADHFGTRHTEFLMTAERARPLFKQYLKNIDQPTIDGFNTFCVSRLASEMGEKVVLSGLGGDELFAGYKSFKLLPKMMHLSTILAVVAPLIKFKAKIFNRLMTPRGRRVLDFLSQPNSLAAAHQSLRGIFSNSETAALMRHYQLSKQSPNQSEIEHSNTKQFELMDHISYLELTRYMRNQLLRDSDVTSMASGLELRVPFIDHILFEKVSAIPSKWRLENGKKLLIDSIPEVPEWVASRPKQGFRFPFDEWFSDAWANADLTLQQHKKTNSQAKAVPNWVKLSPWYRRWSLLVLNDWLARYGEQADETKVT